MVPSFLPSANRSPRLWTNLLSSLSQQQHQELFSFVYWKQIYTTLSSSQKLIHVIKSLGLTTNKKVLNKPSSGGVLGWQDDLCHKGTLTELLPSAARQDLTHLMFTPHTDRKNGKQRGQAHPNMVTAPGMPWGTAPKCFPTGHPATIQEWFPVNM